MVTVILLPFKKSVSEINWALSLLIGVRLAPAIG